MPFRQYDPAIGRWASIDPVTHHSMSTYTGFDNNLVYRSDPRGADAESYDDPSDDLRGLYHGDLQSDEDGLFGWDSNANNGKGAWVNLGNGGVFADVLVYGTNQNWRDEMNAFGEEWGFRLDLDYNEQEVYYDSQQGVYDSGSDKVRSILGKASPYNSVAGLVFYGVERFNAVNSSYEAKQAQHIKGKARATEVLTRANRIKTASLVRSFSKLGLATGVFGTGISYYNIATAYNKNGNGFADVNNWDVADAAGVTALFVNPAKIALVMNPVGLTVVAVGATLYFVGRLVYDIYFRD